MFHSRQKAVPAVDKQAPKAAHFEHAIRRLEPINRLPKSAVDSLLNHTVLEEFAAGESITKTLKESKHVAYLVDGTIRLDSDDDHSESLEAGSPNALKAIDRRSSAFTDVFAIDKCVFVKIPWDLLESYLLEHVPGEITGNFQVDEILAATASNWMIKLLQSELFTSLPATSIQEVLSLVESMPYSAGEKIIEQGDRGSDFYIVESGECIVTRKTSKSEREIKLATLGPADYFGEEALISGGPRGASVTMSTDGRILKLNEGHFNKCLMEPTIKRISVDEAIAINGQGCEWIDTRNAGDYAQGAIPGSRNIDVSLMRLTANQLDTDKTYVVCDEDPKIAAVGAFLLSIRGFEARCLNEPIDAYCAAAGIEMESPASAASRDVPPTQPIAASSSANGQPSDDDEPVVSTTMEIVDKLSEAHRDLPDEEPHIAPDFSETVTGIGLVQLMGELKKNYKTAEGDDPVASNESAVEASPPATDTDEPAAIENGAMQPDCAGSASTNDTEPERSQTRPAPEIEYPPLDVAELLTSRLTDLSKDLETKIAAHTQRMLDQQRAQLEKEFESRITEVKQQAQNSMKAHEQKVAHAYKTKYKDIQENGRKLIALANKISRQKSELLTAKKLLEEQTSQSAG